jgi:nitronate monooxygenase
LEVGADGLILLTAGAGGNAGWANPFAFVRAVREFYSGTVVLAGGISDAVAMRAAKTLGCDLVYMGTRFIATIESRAGDSYRDAIVRGTMDDVALSSKLTGLPANILTTSPGYAELSSSHLYRDGAFVFDSTIFSAGHSIGGVRAVKSVRSVVDDLVAEYNEQ